MSRLLAVCLAAAALVAAGCGGSSSDDYQNDVREIGQKLQDSSVGEELRNVESPQQLGEALRKAADLLDEAAADLEDLEPPDDAAAAHRKVTEGARETGEVFRTVADQAEGGNAQEVLSSLGQLTGKGGAKKLEEGLTELEEKGYDVRDEQGE
jgi:hypothetical protein